MRKNSIAPVLFQDASRDLKASAQLHYLQMQKVLRFLKKSDGWLQLC